MSAESSLPLVFIHGWGSNAGIWQPVLERLSAQPGCHPPTQLIELPGFGKQAAQHCASLDVLYRELEKVLPPMCHLIGWSLGGMIATQLAARCPQRYASLTTIACNAKFVADQAWQDACAPILYEEFLDLFNSDAQACFTRFTQLQVLGDAQRKPVLAFLRGVQGSPQGEQKTMWQAALHWLGAIDNRASLAELAVPHLAIFGEHDKLVPVALVEQFVQQRMATKTLLVPAASHVPHVSQPDLVVDTLIDFIAQLGRPQLGLPQQRNKQRVAQSFSRAAFHYDQLANLQRDVAEKLLSFQGDYRGLIGDLGCGTGFCSAPLRATAASLMGIDIAEGMVQRYRAKLGLMDGSGRNGESRCEGVCADFESLPFAAQSFDALVSSMSLQWSEALAEVFTEVYRVLKPGGWMLFSTLGPGTLNQLKTAWQTVDEFVHVNEFLDASQVHKIAQENHFEVLMFEREYRTLDYADIFALMRELKCIGANNQNSGKNQGLMGKKKLIQLQQAYERYRRDDLLPATYEVYYFLIRPQLIQST